MTVLSYIAMACSCCGNIFVNRKKVIGMWVWIAGNILWIAFAIYTHTWAQLIMFLVYFILNIEGIIRWTKKDKKPEITLSEDEKIVKELCNTMSETFIKKDRDYGNSVEKTFLKYGPMSIVVRLEDKLNRLNTLLQKKKEEQLVKDESITDTLLDLATYAVIAVMLLRKHRKK